MLLPLVHVGTDPLAYLFGVGQQWGPQRLHPQDLLQRLQIMGRVRVQLRGKGWQFLL